MKKNIKMYIKITVVILGALVNLQCGSADDTAAGLTIGFSPSEPIVIPVDTTIYNGTDGDGNILSKDIPGPWFKVKFSFKNETGKCITIAALKGEVFGSNGASVAKLGFDPSQVLGNEDSNEPLAILSSKDADGNYLDCITPTGADPAGSEEYVSSYFWYIGGIRENADESFKYQVTIEPQGWFGTEFDAEERLIKSASFTTR